MEHFADLANSAMSNITQLYDSFTESGFFHGAIGQERIFFLTIIVSLVYALKSDDNSKSTYRPKKMSEKLKSFNIPKNPKDMYRRIQ